MDKEEKTSRLRNALKTASKTEIGRLKKTLSDRSWNDSSVDEIAPRSLSLRARHYYARVLSRVRYKMTHRYIVGAYKLFSAGRTVTIMGLSARASEQSDTRNAVLVVSFVTKHGSRKRLRKGVYAISTVRWTGCVLSAKLPPFWVTMPFLPSRMLIRRKLGVDSCAGYRGY